MGTDVRDVKRFGLWIKSIVQEQPLLGFCACVLLSSLVIAPDRLLGEESSVAPAQPSADQLRSRILNLRPRPRKNRLRFR